MKGLRPPVRSVLSNNRRSKPPVMELTVEEKEEKLLEEERRQKLLDALMSDDFAVEGLFKEEVDGICGMKNS